MCPVWVFHLLRERARLRSQATLTGCKRKALQRRMEQLFQVAQVATLLEGRRRQLFTAHLTRVAAVCYLRGFRKRLGQC